MMMSAPPSLCRRRRHGHIITTFSLAGQKRQQGQTAERVMRDDSLLDFLGLRAVLARWRAARSKKAQQHWKN